MKRLIKDSDNDKVFKEVYNIELSQMILNFKNQVIEYEKNKRK